MDSRRGLKGAPVLVVLFLCAAQACVLRGPRTETFSTMSNAIDAIAARYKVPVGVEYATNEADRSPVDLDLSPLEPAAGFNNLVAQKPGYAWKIDDGVYDVYPRTVTNSLSGVSVRTFSVYQATPREVSAAIGDLSEVRQWLARNQVRRNEFEVNGSRWAASDKRISLSIKGASLRSILNRISLETGRMRWTVVRYGKNGELIGIYM